MSKELKKAIRYYDKFSRYYDWLSPKRYYHKARNFGIQQLQLKEGATVLNVPCGTGQNFEYFQKYMNGSGLIIGIDLSEGMLEKAKIKQDEHNWYNIQLIKADATQITPDWIKENVGESIQVDAIFCDLGLSGFPEWEKIIDTMLSILSPNGRLVIMDWYIPKPTLRGKFIKWIGKGEVDRPIYQYLKNQVMNFAVNDTFNRGGVFVATGIKR